VTRDELIARAKERGFDDAAAAKAADAYLASKGQKVEEVKVEVKATPPATGPKSGAAPAKSPEASAPAKSPPPKQDKPADVMQMDDEFIAPTMGTGKSAKGYVKTTIEDARPSSVPKGVAASFGRADLKRADEEMVQGRDLAGETRAKQEVVALREAMKAKNPAMAARVDGLPDEDVRKYAAQLGI
jgi:hypothetical protein